jgi:pSer/pThr/pTyr-binding forkhead associated (FHA) protein/S1-C subfamily serine protease
MERIVLRHLSGSKVNQVEEFPLHHVPEVVLGRDPSATVKFDPDRDDLVGRLHAKITRDSGDPTVFNITDLQSRNGTYVNKQRIVDTARIVPGDLIQLGPGGPVVQFDLEPRPETSPARATREALSDPMAPTVTGNPYGAVPNTRTIDVGHSSSDSSALSRRTVGKATVERMISETVTQTKKAEGRRYMMISGAALIGVLLLFGAVAGYLAYRGQASEAELGKVQKEIAGAPMSQNQIVAANANTVVKIDISWKLLSPTGLPVYHQYGNLDVRKDKKGPKQLVPQLSQEPIYPCYIRLADGSIEPWLTTANNSSTYPILGQYSGTGFVVGNDGYILTTRFNALAWENEYPLPNFERAFLYDAKSRTYVGLLSREDLINEHRIPLTWVPAKTRQAIDGTTGKFTGINDSLYVTLPGSGRRIAGQLITGSNQQHDVALIKVSLPSPLQAVTMSEDSATIKQGDSIGMLGYPEDAVREVTVARTKVSSRNPADDQIEIASPTFYPGSIGRLLRGQEASSKEGVYSELGDVYQLTISSTTLGNSGSPIFDDRGRVIAIFSVGPESTSTRTFAVPIRYGKELMASNANFK